MRVELGRNLLSWVWLCRYMNHLYWQIYTNWMMLLTLCFASFAGHGTKTPLDTPLCRLGVLENLHMVGPYPPTPQQSYAHMLGSTRTLDHQPTDLSVYTTGQMRDLKVLLNVI